ncbi:CDP-alcohol phosphatidyltransferase family protein [Salinibacterium sp. G-O1]|uniref:CDP-alcohol phosphatidyltransferase family protein n=1 Tax=Salinibacterium sp. G-O1 TaxID=3046208 RepID=UPI0024BB4D35|nr:CDP-alcohol phosphatidyltransferase family protein [Salinibacterium sp. G-O1]MDJ0336131.1 CDP-alcohol phosphatidyltransferase family protein [Salinibacterium sp. G-O1]
MIDAQLRRAMERPVAIMAARIDVPWITPDRLTVAGLVVGLGSAGLAAAQWWWLALAAWLVSRVLDGLDGSLARRRRARNPQGSTSEAGGFLDITADFVVYGATVVGVAVGATAGAEAPWWPFLAVLLAYYINGATFLAFSSIAERTGRQVDDGRSLSFLGRVAEGGETIAVHSAWLIVPAFAWQIAVGWAAIVMISAVQRMIVGYRLLR